MSVGKKIIMGIDPGLADTGWGVIIKDQHLSFVACGSIKTLKTMPLTKRLLVLEKELGNLFKKYLPDNLAIEKLFFNTNTTTAISVAQARGVILLVAAHHHLDITELTPLQIKQSLTNSGQAPKDQVGRMVVNLLKLPQLPKPDDAVDGLACAIAAAGHLNLRSLL